MSKKTWYTALTGLAFLVLLIIGFITGGSTFDPTKDAAVKIAQNYHDHKNSIITSSFIEAVAGAVLVYYGLHLRHAMRESALAPMILVGTVVVAIGLAIDADLSFALVTATDNPHVAISSGSIQTLSLLYNNDFIPFVLGAGLFGTSAGIATIQTGVFPKWLGWIAVVLGVIAFAGPAGFVALIGLIIWIAATSVMLALRLKNS